MEIERSLVQSEWAGFTVTKKRSNKSAPALRTVNPRSSIFIIQPATAKLIKVLFAAALWNKAKKKQKATNNQEISRRCVFKRR